jgi:hypothetical protein
MSFRHPLRALRFLIFAPLVIFSSAVVLPSPAFAVVAWNRVSTIDSATATNNALCTWSASGAGTLECAPGNPYVVGGAVGIGSASPLDALDIGTTTFGIHINSGIPTTTAAALYNNGGTLTWNGSPLTTGGVTGIGSTGYDAIWSSPTSIGTGLIYESGGKVGIGTTSPANLLTVGASNQFQVNSGGNVTWASSVAPTVGITPPTADTAVNTLTINGQGAYGSATTNVTGGAVLIQGGSFVGNQWSTSNGVTLKESSSTNDSVEVRSIGYSGGIMLYPSTAGSISALALGGNITCMGQGSGSGHSSYCTSAEQENTAFFKVINSGGTVEMIPGDNHDLSVKSGFGNPGGSPTFQNAGNLTLQGGDAQASTNAGSPAVAGTGGAIYLKGGLGGLSQSGLVQGNGGNVYIYGLSHPLIFSGARMQPEIGDMERGISYDES